MLVSRVKSKTDSRKNIINITNKGNDLFLKITPLILNSFLKIQEGITEDEMNSFIKIITKIQFNLKQQTI